MAGTSESSRQDKPTVYDYGLPGGPIKMFSGKLLEQPTSFVCQVCHLKKGYVFTIGSKKKGEPEKDYCTMCLINVGGWSIEEVMGLARAADAEHHKAKATREAEAKAKST